MQKIITIVYILSATLFLASCGVSLKQLNETRDILIEAQKLPCETVKSYLNQMQGEVEKQIYEKSK